VQYVVNCSERRIHSVAQNCDTNLSYRTLIILPSQLNGVYFRGGDGWQTLAVVIPINDLGFHYI